MRMMPTIGRACIGLCLAAVIPMVGFGQGRAPGEAIGGPLTGPPVAGVPFSADAITTVRLTLPDGTPLDQSTTVRYYRDGAGRTRLELKMDGLGAPATVAQRLIRTIVAPDGKDGVFALDPVTRTTRYLDRSWLAYAAGGGGADAAILDSYTYDRNNYPKKPGGFTFAVPIRGDGRDLPVRFLMLRRAQDFLATNTATPISDVQDESLGKQLIADVQTTGRRVTMTIPAFQLGNDKPFEMVDERWESAELKLLISAHLSDSRLGNVEYRLTNIRRIEPPADLFVVPPDYRIDTTAAPHDQPIALIDADRYPKVGMSYGQTGLPR